MSRRAESERRGDDTAPLVIVRPASGAALAPARKLPPQSAVIPTEAGPQLRAGRPHARVGRAAGSANRARHDAREVG